MYIYRFQLEETTRYQTRSLRLVGMPMTVATFHEDMREQCNRMNNNETIDKKKHCNDIKAIFFFFFFFFF